MEKENKKILEIKKQLLESGIDTTNLVYMPVIPFVIEGFISEHSFIIEEHFGMKVAKLVSSPNE